VDDVALFQELILTWFDEFGRKNLPWQENKTPYRVWVSEIMLQQTQVSTVISYFLRFMKRFPTITALANASEDDVLHLWTGLGYYNRARNLLRTAKIIQHDYQGEFPQELALLESLPGIGRSTAGAILSLASSIRAPILDGNVKRVLTRFAGITTATNNTKTIAQLWTLADHYTPTQRIADYTQAMMDLGATICTRSQPKCLLCPLMKQCSAYKQDLQSILPIKKPSKSLPIRKKIFLILSHDNTILLEKRPPVGVWAKLWSLPEMSHTTSLPTIKTHCLNQLKINVKKITLDTPFRHTFSHFHLDILPAFIHLETLPLKCMENDQQIWYNLSKPQAIGLPQPVKKLMQKIYDSIN